MRPLKRPQRYAKVRQFSWAPYLRVKVRVMMPFEVRRAIRQQNERTQAYFEGMCAMAERHGLTPLRFGEGIAAQRSAATLQ